MCRKIICLISFVLLLNLVSSFSVASAAGLLNRYSFIDGDTVAVDSVSGRNGTLRGTATISENQLVLNGGTSDVNLPGNILDPGLTSVTIEAWFQQNSTANWQRLFDFGQTQGINGGNCLFYTPASGSNDSRFVIGTNGIPSWQTGEQMVTTTRVTINTPTHVVCVYDGAFPRLRLYQNGVLKGTTAVTAPHSLSKVARMFAYIGSSVYTVDPHLIGRVDEFRIYDTALTDAEVLANFNAGPEPERASKPNPAYGATIQIEDVTLSWKPGAYAVKHDVYFGTELDTVHDANRGNPLNVLVSQNREPNNYPVSGLIRGKTYYWRIDEVDGSDIWQGNIWKFTVKPIKAWDPDPNGVEYVFTDPNFSWNAGFGSTKSKVWFGTSPGSLVLQTTITHTAGKERYSYLKTGLNTNQFYYWRVDQVQSTGPDVTGDGWQFKTGPSSDPNLVGWWKFDEGEGSTAFDSSGRRNHGILINGPQWTTGYVKGALQFDGADDYVILPIGSLISSLSSTTIGTWVNFTNTGGTSQRIFDFGNNQTVYMYLSPSTGTDGVMRFAITIGSGESLMDAPSTLATGWHHVAVVINGSNNTMQLYFDSTIVVSGTTATLPSALGNTTNNWLGRSQFVSDAYFSGTLDEFRIYNRTMTADEISTIGAPTEAWLPNPDDGATDVEPILTISWNRGVKAAQHDVYFSDSEDAVNDANSSDPCGPGPEYVYKGRKDANNYGPINLEFDHTYYWRVDEVNDSNLWRSDIWSFTARNFVSVDDFEKQTTWIGSGGGTVGDKDPNYPVHGDRLSMPFDYNNTTSTYSDATRTYASVQNWEANDVKSLTLWLRGYPASVGSFTRSGTDPNYTYTMTASGADIWDTHDEFHYAYIPTSEDEVTIVAKVESISNTDEWAKAGLMIRISADADSAHVMVCVTPSTINGVAIQHRAEAGGATTNDINVPNITAPCWLRLKAIVNELGWWDVTPAYSTCGTTGEPNNWIDVSQIQLHTSTYPLIGLSLTAHNTAPTCTAVFSNVTVNGAIPPSWTDQDIGIKSNIAAPLYVTLQDSSTPAKTAKVTHPDPNVVLQTTWQEWNIALSEFTNKTPGLDLTKIKKITIGVDRNSYPTGTLYFDDIRLYRPRCLPGVIVPDSAGGNCLIDEPDLQILTDNWLISNYQVTPASWNPDGDANLVAYYNFNGNFNDTKGHNGEPNGASIITDLVRGQVANFDGINDYVSLPIGPDINSMSSSSFATWVNFSNGGGSWQRIFDFGNNSTVYMFLTPRVGTNGVMRFAITTSSAGGESLIDAPSTLARGWHHVAVVINGVSKTMQLCLDGVVVASGTTAVLPTDLGNTTNNWLGRSQWTADAYFTGYLDDFRIYNRVLSPGEVASLADKTASFTQPLYLLLTPKNLGINLYNDGRIDLKDYAVLADVWLEKILWP